MGTLSRGHTSGPTCDYPDSAVKNCNRTLNNRWCFFREDSESSLVRASRYKPPSIVSGRHSTTRRSPPRRLANCSMGALPLTAHQFLRHVGSPEHTAAELDTAHQHAAHLAAC